MTTFNDAMPPVAGFTKRISKVLDVELVAVDVKCAVLTAPPRQISPDEVVALIRSGKVSLQRG